MRQPFKTNSWRELHAAPATARRVITADDVAAAYQQGRRDCESGWSIGKARYSDFARDQAWLRGYSDALRQRLDEKPMVRGNR